MWSGPLHDPSFIARMLDHLESNQSNYGTAVRMKGMLTVAKEVYDALLVCHLSSTIAQELPTLFYFTPAKVSSFFHCNTPSLDDVAWVVDCYLEFFLLTYLCNSSGLLHAGHRISRSHACPGSLKTTATRHDLHDVFRSWVKLHPVKLENISESSPTRRLLAVEPKSSPHFALGYSRS